MAYIGKTPVIGNFVKLDAITAVNGQAAYTMQNGGSNFTDYESVNQFLVSLNGTIQAPTDSFTVSGSTLTFASNLSTGDVIDFIMVFGNSLSAGTPTDGTVTAAKLASTSITGQTAEATVANDDTVLIHDTSASALRKMTVSNLTANAGVAGISSSADATAITIDSSERVGIGTTSPGSLLELKHGTNLRMMFDSTVDDQCTIRAQQDSAGHNAMRLEADNIAFRTASGSNTGVERMRIDNAGNVIIHGTASAQLDALSIAIDSTYSPYLQFNSSYGATKGHQYFQYNTTNVGSITSTTSATSYNTSSDYRLKENVSYDFDATSRLKQLKPARFNFIIDKNKTVDGFLAHEVSSIVPEAITGQKDAVNEDGSIQPQSIDQSKLVPLLVKTIQELEARITELENN